MEFHHFTATFPWSFPQIIAGGDLPVQCLVRPVLNPCKVVKFVSFPMKVVHSPTLLNQNRKSVNTKKDLAKMWPGKLNVDMFFFCSKMFATSQLLQKSWKFWKLTFLFKKQNKKTFRFHSRFGRSVQNIVLFFLDRRLLHKIQILQHSRFCNGHKGLVTNHPLCGNGYSR